MLCGAIPPPYRHRKRSRGIFVATPFLIPALIRLHEAPYPPMHGKDRLPVSVHTHTSFDRQRKRFLVCARNDTWGRIAPHSFSHRRIDWYLSETLYPTPSPEGCFSPCETPPCPCEAIPPLVSSSRAQSRDLCCTAAICTYAPSLKRHLGASFFAFPSPTVYRSAVRIPPLRSG